MLQTVEAEIDVNGNVRLLEPLRVTRKMRAIVTVLEVTNDGSEEKGNSKMILEWPKLPQNKLYFDHSGSFSWTAHHSSPFFPAFCARFPCGAP